ncbi:hypothetical protein TVAG_348520 [Trichomonas vaginalis G3]|uniref:Surface antigen BspA-like n=1 Tax=Trichomonas vaginalis (strain ATCC PRA-98 / G3) TaxID=412133 RepID=A2DSZ3_TRIV3|nr:ribonuclease inhibitor domain-containing protein [Trichomonas vaginalis G3]EAY16542.1 hypothetical protein TVAG_348520 [Trichomonas vaginalis G3]KAI5493545.1 ribonuclease inhibitor domain-containing protein [Trichomonas vaginalis G3]|eukprot:XP_001328765.1 hypothetical protein [Trichomonas vaginalis G3]
MSSSAFSTLPLKKLIVFNQDEYFYGSNMDGILNFPNLKTIEITSDSKYIYLINYNIEEIITPVDPNFRCTINIAGCPKLKNLPNGIEYVKNVGDLPEVESVDLSFCKRIYRNSFFNCPKLKRIIGWGDHEMTVEPSLFELCPMIDINIWNNNLKFYGVTMFSDKYSPLQYSYIKELTINSSKIPTFYGCKQLKKVVFIEGCGIREIDYHAFENCESLTDVQLCNSIESISPYAFANTNISNLDLTNVRQIALTAFYNTPLKEIIINNNIFQSRPDYYWPTDVVLLEYNERNHSKFRNFICLSGKFGSQGIDNSRFCEIY